MSCFMMPNNRISAIANYICDFIVGQYEIPRLLPSDLKGLEPFWLEGTGRFGEKLYRDLWELNRLALVERYGDSIGTGEDAPVLSYEVSADFDDVYQFCKSLNCYIFQCREGDLDEAHYDILTVLQCAKRYICEAFVESQDMYDQAEWG